MPKNYCVWYDGVLKLLYSHEYINKMRITHTDHKINLSTRNKCNKCADNRIRISNKCMICCSICNNQLSSKPVRTVAFDENTKVLLCVSSSRTVFEVYRFEKVFEGLSFMVYLYHWTKINGLTKIVLKIK